MRRRAGTSLPLFGLLLVAVVAASPSTAARAEEMTLAAGAGYRRPIAEIAAAFEKTSGHKVNQVYGHMGMVITQARETGQVSLVCGDRKVLDAAQGVSFVQWVRLGAGRLVVAYRKGLVLTKAEDLVRDDVRRIGIPDQKNAVFGIAGRQFLDRAQLAAALDPKLIAVATVPQVTSYVASGETDAGFVNATDAIGMGSNIGGFVAVDAKFYDPVEVACAVVAPAKDSPVVAAFSKYLVTDPARAILGRYGL